MKNRTSLRLLKPLFAAVIPILAAVQASASIIVHEPFEYERRQGMAGVDIPGEGIDGLNGGIGFGGPWTSIGDWNSGIPEGEDDYAPNDGWGVVPGARDAPLSYTDSFGNSLVTSGNQVRTAFGNSSWERRLLENPIGEPGSTVWVSFLAQAHGLAGSSRWAFVELSNNGADRAWIGNVNPVSTGNWGIQFPDRSAGAVAEDAGGDYPMNVQTMFLVKLEFPTDPSESTNFSVWLNPEDLVNEGALGAPLFFLDTDYAQYTHLGVAGRYSTDFDEIRIGTTFDSVTPIPEPATYALVFGLSVASMLLMRRRFSNRTTI